VITGAQFQAMSDDQALHAVDDAGVIARVTPEDKVRLVDLLKRQNHVVAMTGDGVNDAPALKRADIGIAMGITGTEVTKEAAVMILTDDNFSTIVKAVELGRALYDNLTKYVRFQMGCLFGFIISFLGAAIFNVAGGVPFLPLQTLWVNFMVDVPQAIGLGYGQPATGLMERKPRPQDEPILPRGLMIWLVTVGLIMGVGTLGVISWAEQAHNKEIAHTMGLVTFSLFNLFFSIAVRDERRTIFSLDTISDKIFVRACGVSILTIILAVVFGPLQRFLETTYLDVQQWIICICVALSIIVASEIRRIILATDRRRAVPADGPAPNA
jgi:P-type Ca2+ transporter type 2C